ncbi:unnamed protein product [Euphydryas editha]|uniref:Tc1-like transposase DDE domain-containing protein n=1 Tax=Euphydryas editha TaxID=104508 RepID=A0AAU9TU65_EUPED|nr:unnamed protein product [Euphydryas editha]
MSRKSQRVVLKSHAREIISKVFDFMKKEASKNYAEKITDARWRTAQAVGVSESTVTRILRERKEYTSTMKVKSFRIAGRTIVHTDESYIHTNHVQKKSWAEECSKTAIKQNLTKGVRIIIIHAGSAEGFVPNALLTYSRAEIKSGDYHDNMNTENYLKLLQEKLIPNLPNHAVVVMDNAAYHNTSSGKIPTSNSNKLDMQTWLNAKNIHFEPSYKKPELYDLILKNKKNFRKYKVDELLKEHGFTVLRLPI